MAGLDPAIHVFVTERKGRRGCPAQGRAWRGEIGAGLLRFARNDGV